jgi:hypothetical protein
MIGRIETEVERNGKIEQGTRYYLCSLCSSGLCALTFARAVRGALGVENRLHWVWTRGACSARNRPRDHAPLGPIT